ncbi:hypothetical protein NDK37_12395 [Xanthomonas citri pv. glycines]|uniref:hypothetical protein n=1 Tax=Xanthomonas citri TaxID=346 RepID=UPI0027151C42|nr:hypothetical protein [Xanthomonas citri]WLA18096.1 hypothetical protein NDK37_12395 [Xanthomonas citri pv. glycines]
MMTAITFSLNEKTSPRGKAVIAVTSAPQAFLTASGTPAVTETCKLKSTIQNPMQRMLLVIERTGRKKSERAVTDDQLERILYSASDFEQARSALTFLKDLMHSSEQRGIVYQRKIRCFETTLIIAMSRPFDDNQAINLGLIGANLHKEERAVIELVRGLRNKVFAHSDKLQMHYSSEVVEIQGVSTLVPVLTFDELPRLSVKQLLDIDVLLVRLIVATSKFIFEFAQKYPERIRRYRKPT